MQLIAGVLATTALGLASLSVYLHSKLDAERERASIQLVHCHDLEAQIANLTSVDASTAPSPSIEGAETLARAFPEVRAEAASATDLRGSDVGPPVRREFERRRQEAALRQMYRGLARELKLSPELEGHLLRLLLDQRTEQMEAVRKSAHDPTEMRQAMSELDQQNATELMSVLGDKYLPFEDYQRTLGERMQIEQVSLQLEAANVPLDDDQQQRLLHVMVEERERTPRPAWIESVGSVQNAATMQQWQDDYAERVRNRLSSILKSDQLKQYDVYCNLQSTMRRRQRETWRAEAPQTLALRAANPGTM